MLRDPALIPLSHQHQHALALCVLSDKALDAGDAVDTVAGGIRAQFDSEIREHFAAEEEVLFPAAPPELTALTRELISEHRRLEALAAALDTPHAIREFTAALRAHVRKEEGELFEGMQQLMSPEALADVGARCAARLSPPQCRID